jgi:hypothetical protein
MLCSIHSATKLQFPDQIKISEYHLTIAGQLTDRKLKGLIVTRADQQNILMTFYDHTARSPRLLSPNF